MPEQTSSFEINQPVRTVEINHLKIGGDSSFHFLKENSNTAKPLYAMELNIFDTSEMPDVVKKEFYGTAFDIVKSAQNTNCDILCLKFNIG